MNEQAAEARRAYKREWARKNPDKVKAQQERYWERKAAQQATNSTNERPERTERGRTE